MKKICFFLFVCMFLGAVSVFVPVWSNSENQEILRLHIIAHSDNQKDQNLKLEVRDEVLRDLIALKEFNDFSQVIGYLKENLSAIEKNVNKVVEKNGFQYPVNVAITKSHFPTRYYGEKIYPAGEYLALKIVIGEGKGSNWWCVLYPTLCFLELEEESEILKVEKDKPPENDPTALPAISQKYGQEKVKEKEKKGLAKKLYIQWQEVVKEMWTVTRSP